jgi:glycosyltransferase involved in cell wall biosynthesis
MKTKIYYLTRSYAPYQKSGGPLMRTGAVLYLQELGWNVIVVMPNYNSDKLVVSDDIIQIPLNYNIKFQLNLERLGLNEDYLDKWVQNSFEYLVDKIQKDDIIFSTSGGELGMIKLGSLLKDTIDCKFIINYHDPLDYSLVNGLKLNKKFHTSREKQEKKYIKNSNLIITSSKTNQISLKTKYPDWKQKIVNNYFGYIKQLSLSKYKITKSKKLRIAYAGNMGNLQKPEILYEICQDIDGLELYFIGDTKNNKVLKNIKKKNIHIINYLPHQEFMTFMIENIDIGSVSLTNDYLSACIPSKIYEYINLGLPIIGALPDGDGKDIINQNSYGIACKYDDINGLKKAIIQYQDKNYLEKYKMNIINSRNQWDMKTTIKEIDTYLKEQINAN